MTVIGSEASRARSTSHRTGRRALLGARWLVCTVALALAGSPRAQAPSEPPSPPSMPPHPHPPHGADPSLLGADPIGAKLFPPELIMKHQQELGIDDRQRDAILKEIERAHSQLFPLQWQMSAAAEQLSKALEAPKLDEGKVLAQADQVMALERDIKRAHLSLLIRLRNVLSDAQRAKLAELRAKHEH
ncbi:MAG TPA: periplasmic heavy metal sensor [Myxococcaceae bacterium]|nr:periplasmic heavy metal sensor [Myxococcaceae bacterium]